MEILCRKVGNRGLHASILLQPQHTLYPLGKKYFTPLSAFFPSNAELAFMVPTEGHSPTNGPEKGRLLQETPVLCQGVHFSLISPKKCTKFRDKPSSCTVQFTLNLTHCLLTDSA